jgi:RHS repeat-associated protein
VIGSFTASPKAIQPGQPSILSWSTENTATITLKEGDAAPVTVAGASSKTVSPGTKTTYTLTATNNAGKSVSKTVTVTVLGVFAWKRDLVYLGNKLVAEVDAAGAKSVLTDHLGSPRILVNPDGSVVEQKFAPFGESLTEPADAKAFGMGYTGHVQTDASGLIYMQARFYLPMYHRFGSPDPGRDQHFDQTQSWNIYSYVQNNPVMNVDPTGMWTGKVHVQLTAILAYAAGYNKESASKIGLATGRADEKHNAVDAGIRSALSGLAGGMSSAAQGAGDYAKEASYHFPELGALPGKEAAFKASGSVADYGDMMHLKQDALNPGHEKGIAHGPKQDWTSKHEDKAMDTALMTFSSLLGAEFKGGEVKKDGQAIDISKIMPELRAYMKASESGKDYEKAKDALWTKVSQLRENKKEDKK